MQKILSFNELQQKLSKESKTYLLLYKSTGSEVNACAMKSIEQASKENKDTLLMYADVNSVRDIHPNYPIQSVPVLIEFNKTDFVNTYKGCYEQSFYNRIFSGSSTNSTSVKGETQKQVTVYSSPSCSWCNTLKTYLRKNNIRFREVDVSRNQAEAQAMVNRSGQQGVPQTLIDGQMIVGFDKKRINTLLGIN